MFVFCLLLALLPQILGHAVVVGNFAVVGKTQKHVSTDSHPLKIAVGKLWCGVQKLGEFVPIEYGQFTQVNNQKVFEADVEDKKKAVMDVGRAVFSVAGTYRCEVRTEDNEILSGLSFIYLPPVLELPDGYGYTEYEARPPRVVGEPLRATIGEELLLRCPVFGYPQPFVHWEKDGKPVDNEFVEFDGDNLKITSVMEDHAGTYSCIADNSFPMFVDGPAMPHQLVYEQKLTISS